ncbi:MAG TPA: response regulator transcription factor [Candidatus Lumbricidophila sp.]|nr:response regulator transcription factor [Candidatus Lumbricidophila sp.]
MRVAIADDQVLFCSGIEMLIRSQPDLEFVGAAFDGETAIVLVEQSEPDVVLMDVRMPILDGVTATREIVRRRLRTLVIMLTTHEGDLAIIGAIDAGARGFVLKDSTPELLLAAIRSVHAGQSVFTPASPRALVRDVELGASYRPNTAAIAQLSDRERAIFLLAAAGLSTGEIAERAYVTESTVKTHISNILAKLGLRSRLQLVSFAHRHHLVS